MGQEKNAENIPFLRSTQPKSTERVPVVELSGYEAHLDRKFERTLSMLLKLKEIRGNQDDSSNKRFLNENQTVIKG